MKRHSKPITRGLLPAVLAVAATCIVLAGLFDTPIRFRRGDGREYPSITVRPDWLAARPRVLLTPRRLAELRAARERFARNGWWQPMPRVDVAALPTPTPTDTRPARRIADYALTWLLTGRADALTAACELLDRACALPDWGAGEAANIELEAAFALYGVSLGYDWLHGDLPPALRRRVREKLIRQGTLMHRAAAGGVIWWSDQPDQNHCYINAQALLLAGLALYDEHPRAAEWVDTAAGLLRETFAVWPRSGQGDFHEGANYWDFSLLRLLRAAEALRLATGEDLPAGNPWFERTAHWRWQMASPPAGRNVNIGDQVREFRPSWATFALLARRTGDPAIQGMADRVTADRLTADYTLWRDAELAGVDPAGRLPRRTAFRDTGVAVMRSSWADPDAVLLAFTAAPLGSHHHVRMARQGVRIMAGHAHPDANSFLLMGGADYLAIDDGYVRVKRTANHNTLLIDGTGQAGSGETWPEPRADRVAALGPAVFSPGVSCVSGEAAGMYHGVDDLRTFRRWIVSFSERWFAVCDELDAAGPHDYQWLLLTDRPPKIDSSARLDVHRGDSAMTVRWLAPEVSVRAEPAGFDYFAAYAEATDAVRTVAMPVERRARQRFCVTLQPRPAGQPADPLEAIRAGDAIGVVRREDRREQLVLFNPGGDCQAGDLSGAGRVLAVDRTDVRTDAFCLARGTRIEAGGVRLLEADVPISAAVTYGDEAVGSLDAPGAAPVRLHLPRPPAEVTIDSEPVDFTFDAATRTVRFICPAGRHRTQVRYAD